MSSQTSAASAAATIDSIGFGRKIAVSHFFLLTFVFLSAPHFIRSFRIDFSFLDGLNLSLGEHGEIGEAQNVQVEHLASPPARKCDQCVLNFVDSVLNVVPRSSVDCDRLV